MPSSDIPAIAKREPKSTGITTPRKKTPQFVARVLDNCTGCSGSPVCVGYCPVADCIYWVPDPERPPFGVVEVDPALCIGCKLCASHGPNGTMIEGCPWDAIEMVPLNA